MQLVLLITLFTSFQLGPEIGCFKMHLHSSVLSACLEMTEISPFGRNDKEKVGAK
jgi:hypothetical protein